MEKFAIKEVNATKVFKILEEAANSAKMVVLRIGTGYCDACNRYNEDVQALAEEFKKEAIFVSTDKDDRSALPGHKMELHNVTEYRQLYPHIVIMIQTQEGIKLLYTKIGWNEKKEKHFDILRKKIINIIPQLPLYFESQ